MQRKLQFSAFLVCDIFENYNEDIVYTFVALGLEQDVPEYDMDSDDELWIDLQRKRLDLTPLKFEQMMDRLEKSSGQTVVTLNEAKALLKQDDEVSIAVYDYWLNKRLKMVITNNEEQSVFLRLPYFLINFQQ